MNFKIGSIFHIKIVEVLYATPCHPTNYIQPTAQNELLCSVPTNNKRDDPTSAGAKVPIFVPARASQHIPIFINNIHSTHYWIRKWKPQDYHCRKLLFFHPARPSHPPPTMVTTFLLRIETQELFASEIRKPVLHTHARTHNSALSELEDRLLQ